MVFVADGVAVVGISAAADVVAVAVEGVPAVDGVSAGRVPAGKNDEELEASVSARCGRKLAALMS